MLLLLLRAAAGDVMPSEGVGRRVSQTVQRLDVRGFMSVHDGQAQVEVDEGEVAEDIVLALLPLEGIEATVGEVGDRMLEAEEEVVEVLDDEEELEGTEFNPASADAASTVLTLFFSSATFCSLVLSCVAACTRLSCSGPRHWLVRVALPCLTRSLCTPST